MAGKNNKTGTNELSQRLQFYRKQTGLTQENMAIETGLSVNYISALERGVNSPNAATLIAYAKACHVSIDELTGIVPEVYILPELKDELSDVGFDTQQLLLDILLAIKKSNHKKNPS